MPLYMDHHRAMIDPEPTVYEQLHKKDLELQSKYGVKFVGFWVDERQYHMFCLVEAPNKEALFNLHREAHSVVPLEIFEVVDLA